MKFLNWRNTLGWLMMLLVSSCVEPYFPEVMEAPNSYLVVNGFINGTGPTNIQLLRTQNLADQSPPPTESRAFVAIEAENGEKYRLNEVEQGLYSIDGLSLSIATKYRIFIKTANGKEYASDYVTLKQTPAIEKITWEAVDNEVQFYVSTRDPKNETWYYRWEFENTWQYRAAFTTILKYENGQVVYRDRFDDATYNCWRSEKSTTVELGTSIRLNSDVISNYKLQTIPHNSEKLSIKNSVLVKQYALSREAFEYWEILKKNTENIGTLFDPLPSQLNGNIRSLSDPQEPVIGFMTASTMQEKRVFVDSRELPKEWRLFMPTCVIDTLLFSQGSVSEYFTGGYQVPVSEIYDDAGWRLLGYTYAAKRCVDCTTRGTNVKPAYWE
jgi:hypothetical protein